MEEPGADAGVELDAPPPRPEFRVAEMHGALAIDEQGVRAEYRREPDGEWLPSTLILKLDPTGYSDWRDPCEVSVEPTFVRWLSFGDWQGVRLDPGQGIRSIDCGWEPAWDEAYVQAQLATMPVGITWARAAAPEDWPALDVNDNGVLRRGAGRAFIMHADGVVSWEPLVVYMKSLERGLYEF